MSVYVQDRSGRFTWAIDPTDIDYTKILYNNFNVESPEDAENYSTRTIVARQWNDPNYIASMSQQWNIASGTNAYNYIQFFIISLIISLLFIHFNIISVSVINILLI